MAEGATRLQKYARQRPRRHPRRGCYYRFGTRDLEWARRIFEWQRQTLVDPETGLVWDGINRQGDGRIDKDWKFTYCQGVYIGAAVELTARRGTELSG